MTQKATITALLILGGQTTSAHAAGNAGHALEACTRDVVATCNTRRLRPAMTLKAGN